MLQGVRIMTFKNISGLALLLVLIALGIHWYFTRPTIQESIVTDFFQEFRMGHYPEAQEFASGDDFYAMAAVTSVRDTDNAEYLISDYFPESRQFVLQSAIETFVKPHIAKWKYLHMNTENMDENNAIVHFRIEMAVRDYTSGEFLASVIHNGRVEGNAHMVLDGEEWSITRFELYIFSDDGIVLSDYLKQAH